MHSSNALLCSMHLSSTPLDCAVCTRQAGHTTAQHTLVRRAMQLFCFRFRLLTTLRPYAPRVGTACPCMLLLVAAGRSHVHVSCTQQLSWMPPYLCGAQGLWMRCGQCAHVCARKSALMHMCACARICVCASGHACACTCVCLFVWVHVYAQFEACSGQVFALCIQFV